jgi:hypothetical protein
VETRRRWGEREREPREFLPWVRVGGAVPDGGGGPNGGGLELGAMRLEAQGGEALGGMRCGEE